MDGAKLTQWLDSRPFGTVSARSQRMALASTLGVHRDTVRRWESGATPCPPWLGYALAALAYRLPPLA